MHIEDQQLTPNYKGFTLQLRNKLYDACDDGDIEAIKNCILQGAPIKYQSNFIDIFAVKHVADRGHLNAVDFFLTDPMIQNHPIHKENADIKEVGLKIFQEAYFNSNLRVIEHMINNYHIETDEQIQIYINDKTDDEFKKKIVRLIDKKYLESTLELSLNNSNIINKRMKL